MDPNLECCVLGCHIKRNQGLRFYQFPCHNPQICSIWEQRICQSANVNFDILNDRVCELHFDYRCKTGNECALEDGSLPTLHLPNFGTLFSTSNAHFQMSGNVINELSYTISIEELSYLCRFCLRRGLLYEVEASTYRSKSFLSLIDLSPIMFPDFAQPKACLSCLKSIVIAHQLSVVFEHSNIILQQLLQHPKQSKVVSNTNFFDMKSDLSFCNLILANSPSIKLEIEFEDNMVCANDDYDQKWIPTREYTSAAAFVNTLNLVENSKCDTENKHNVSKLDDSNISDKNCPKEFHNLFSIGAIGSNMTDLSAEGISNANEISGFCVLMENIDDNAEVIFANNSDVSCAEDRKFDNEHASESPSKALNEPTYKCDLCKFTTNYKANLAIHKNLHLAGNDKVNFYCQKCEKYFLLRRHFVRHNTIVHPDDYICKICDKSHPSATKLTVHYAEHQNFQYISSRVFRSGHHANVIRFLCNHCGKGFLQKWKLAAHNKQHAKLENSLKCKECPKEFETKYGHHQHIQTHKQTTFTTNDKNTLWNENDGLYICPICEWKTTSPYSFNAHLGKHVQSGKNSTIETQNLETLETDPARNPHGRYQCTECRTAFENKSDFSRHKLLHTNERPYKCTECPKTFRRKTHVNTHKRIHTNERPYKCTECPKYFRRSGDLRVHTRMHTNERPYKCTECPKTYIQSGHLSEHKRIHTNERPYKCTECPKAFSCKNKFIRHKKIHTNERPFKCTECPKTFSSKSSIDTHNRMHTNERPYKCTECPKTFSQKSTLSRHQKIHTNERPYKCTECPKTFSFSSNLFVHKRIHANERSYKCTECPKCFNYKHNLDVHKRIHTNERPYKCTECPKTFSQSNHLSDHKRIHTNERPYKCTECPKTFSKCGNLSEHKKIHMKERPYKCTECPKTFMRSSHLSDHKKMHTN